MIDPKRKGQRVYVARVLGTDLTQPPIVEVMPGTTTGNGFRESIGVVRRGGTLGRSYHKDKVFTNRAECVAATRQTAREKAANLRKRADVLDGLADGLE